MTKCGKDIIVRICRFLQFIHRIMNFIKWGRIIMLIGFYLSHSFPYSAYISVGLFFISAIILSYSIYIIKKYKNRYRLLYYKEELFNSLCTNLDDVFLIYRFDGYLIEYVSPNLERIYGISTKNFKRNPYTIINKMSPASRAELIACFNNRLLTSNKVLEFEFFNPVLKSMVNLEARIYPEFNKQTLTRYIFSVSDVTTEKQTQQALRDALINAQQANEAKKEFLSHMSHEIRTPLNAINGMAQIAMKSLDDIQKVENCLYKISDSSRRLVSMVSNILDMSKIDSNKLILNQEEFLLNHLLFEISDLVNSQAELNRINFSLNIKNIEHNHLMGDTLRLSQVINNCISNSLKFTPSGGMIRLEAEEKGVYGNKILICFTITDTGNGMSEDFIQRLFVPFEQEDSSIAFKYGGTGLGMSITKNLVTLMSGDIHVSSKPGQGTSIKIQIPFDLFEAKTLSPQKGLSVPKHPEYDFTGCKVLVVEDNEVNTEVICEFLKYVRVKVDTVNNGREALRLFEASAPGYYQIIFLDIQMPDMNGYETAHQIRDSDHPNANSIPIVAMSADSYAEDVSRSLASGMNYHIAKPIDIDLLYHIINQVMNRTTDNIINIKQ